MINRTNVVEAVDQLYVEGGNLANAVYRMADCVERITVALKKTLGNDADLILGEVDEARQLISAFEYVNETRVTHEDVKGTVADHRAAGD